MLMATIQKTTLKRYNGEDWDPVYLANSADISYLGAGFTVVADEATFYADGASIPATTKVSDILHTLVNRMSRVLEEDLPNLADGSSITALDLDSITLSGTVPRANLPTDVGGKGVEVATEAAKSALDSDDVNVGDIVKVTDGKVYLVTSAPSGETPTYMELTDSASDIAWSRIVNTPTTLAGYGITDGVNVSEVVTTATANKILKLDSNGKLPASITGDAQTLETHPASYFATATDMSTAEDRLDTAEDDIDTLQSEIRAIDASWITTGTVSIDRLPAASLERMRIVATPADLANLTATMAQNGDTVKVTSTGAMYYVVDESKFGTADYMDGLVEYTAGRASAIDWSGVENKPTTVATSGLTDAVSTNDIVTSASAANAGKLLSINSNGKLDTDITGDAQTLEGHSASYFATASDSTTLTTRLDTAEADIDALEATVGDAESGLVKQVNDLETYKNGALANDLAGIKDGSLITALGASKLTGTVSYDNLPADIHGTVWYKNSMSSAYSSITVAGGAKVGDLVKISDGGLYAISDTTNLDSAAGYTVLVEGNGSNVEWANILNKPTTVATSGLTDALSTGDTVTSGGAGTNGKILKLNADGKLDASITGDADTLDGHDSTYFATDSDLDTLDARVGVYDSTVANATGLAAKIRQNEIDIKAIDGTWITTGTISIDRLPHGALERCVVVADDTARFTLTTATVQTGDTVKVTSTNTMYFVVDDTNLDSAAGYEVYTAGAATSVPWSGVQNTPTTLAGYGITDAVNSSEKVTTASAANVGKILVLNSNGKLDVDITGHVDWANINDKPTSTVAEIDAAVATATHTNRAVLDKLTNSLVGSTDYLAYDGEELAYLSEVQQVALGTLQIVNAVPATADNGQFLLETIAGV